MANNVNVYTDLVDTLRYVCIVTIVRQFISRFFLPFSLSLSVDSNYAKRSSTMCSVIIIDVVAVAVAVVGVFITCFFLYCCCFAVAPISPNACYCFYFSRTIDDKAGFFFVPLTFIQVQHLSRCACFILGFCIQCELYSLFVRFSWHGMYTLYNVHTLVPECIRAQTHPSDGTHTHNKDIYLDQGNHLETQP